MLMKHIRLISITLLFLGNFGCTKLVEEQDVTIHPDSQLYFANRSTTGMAIKMAVDELSVEQNIIHKVYNASKNTSEDINILFKNLKFCFLGEYFIHKGGNKFKNGSGVYILEKTTDNKIKIWMLHTKKKDSQKIFVRQVVYEKYNNTGIKLIAEGCLYSDHPQSLNLYNNLKDFKGALVHIDLPDTNITHDQLLRKKNRNVRKSAIVGIYSFIVSFFLIYLYTGRIEKMKNKPRKLRFIISLLLALLVSGFFVIKIWH